jgi:hypothetical protein
VGIPFLLGWMIGLMRFQRPVMIAFQYTTVVLCVISPLLGEGVICILMAAPIVYPITMVIAYVVGRSLDHRRGRMMMTILTALPFLYTGLMEDPGRPGELKRLTSTVVISASPAAVWNALEDMTWEIPDTRPGILRLGYPVPQKIVSQKSALGNERRIVFNTGTIVGRITHIDPEKNLTLALSYTDTRGEFFHRWVDLSEMRFELRETAPGNTLLTHTAVYRRKLPLAFYFDPIERLTASVLENYLLTAFAGHVERIVALPVPPAAAGVP